MAIDIYICNSSAPCHTVIMTASYLGIEINKKLIHVTSGEHYKSEFIKMNPQHTVPTLDDGGFCLGESRVIQTYLANRYAPDSPVYPKDPKERAVVDRMLYFDIGTLFEAQKGHLYPLYMDVAPDPEKTVAYHKALALLEGFLGSSPYVAGQHVTLADISIFSNLTFAEAAGFSFVDYPKISHWIEKMKLEGRCYSEIEKSLEIFTEFLKSNKKVKKSSLQK